jgi:hypothetical protein
MKPPEHPNKHPGPSKSTRIDSLTPQQKEFGQLIGRLLARSWHQEHHSGRVPAVTRAESHTSDHAPLGCIPGPVFRRSKTGS